MRRLRALGRRVAGQRSAHAERQAHDGGVLGLVDGEHPVEVVRFDPALQKPRGNGQAGAAVAQGVEFEAREPGGEDVFAQLGAQPPSNAGPGLRRSDRRRAVRARGLDHDGLLAFSTIVEHRRPLLCRSPTHRPPPQTDDAAHFRISRRFDAKNASAPPPSLNGSTGISLRMSITCTAALQNRYTADIDYHHPAICV